MKQANRRKLKRFAEADYDFSGVEPRLGLPACCLYEYARESRAVRAAVASLRKQIQGKTSRWQHGPRVRNQVHYTVMLMLAISSGFPNTSWQCLSDKDKRVLMQYAAALPHVKRFATTWQNPPLIFSRNHADTDTLGMWKKLYQEGRPAVPDSGLPKFGFFAVNMKYSHAVLMEEFAKYLRTFEGKAMLEFPPGASKAANPKPRGRHSYRDPLNALGVMRLRYCCDTFTEAQKMMESLKNKPYGMFYERRDYANRACNRALRYFNELFGWLDPDKPIHFTEGWHGGTQKHFSILAF